jgi:outer membrane protein assembly factor BamB
MNRFFSMRTNKCTTRLLLSFFVAVNPIQVQPLPLGTPLIVRWSFFTDSLSEIAPTGDVESVYVPIYPSTIVSIGVDNGLLRWKADIGGDISGPPVFDAQRVYIISESQAFGDGNRNTLGVLRAISRASGVTLWLKEFPRPLRRDLTASPVSLFACLDDGRFYSIDKLTGDARWMVQLPKLPFATPFLSGEKLYYLTSDGDLIILNHQTGSVMRRYRTGGRIRQQLSIQNGVLYLGTEDGYMFALSEQGGDPALLWRKRVGAGLQYITATPHGVLVTTQDNFVLFLESHHGGRLWKRQMPARLVAPPSLGHETALFAPIGEEACVMLSLHNGQVINYLPVGKDNSVIASPLLAGDWVFIPTRKGVLAFAPARNSPRPNPPAVPIPSPK